MSDFQPTTPAPIPEARVPAIVNINGTFVNGTILADKSQLFSDGLITPEEAGFQANSVLPSPTETNLQPPPTTSNVPITTTLPPGFIGAPAPNEQFAPSDQIDQSFKGFSKIERLDNGQYLASFTSNGQQKGIYFPTFEAANEFNIKATEPSFFEKAKTGIVQVVESPEFAIGTAGLLSEIQVASAVLQLGTKAIDTVFKVIGAAVVAKDVIKAPERSIIENAETFALDSLYFGTANIALKPLNKLIAKPNAATLETRALNDIKETNYEILSPSAIGKGENADAIREASDAMVSARNKYLNTKFDIEEAQKVIDNIPIAKTKEELALLEKAHTKLGTGSELDLGSNDSLVEKLAEQKVELKSATKEYVDSIKNIINSEGTGELESLNKRAIPELSEIEKLKNLPDKVISDSDAIVKQIVNPRSLEAIKSDVSLVDQQILDANLALKQGMPVASDENALDVFNKLNTTLEDLQKQKQALSIELHNAEIGNARELATKVNNLADRIKSLKEDIAYGSDSRKTINELNDLETQLKETKLKLAESLSNYEVTRRYEITVPGEGESGGGGRSLVTSARPSLIGEKPKFTGGSYKTTPSVDLTPTASAVSTGKGGQAIVAGTEQPAIGTPLPDNPSRRVVKIEPHLTTTTVVPETIPVSPPSPMHPPIPLPYTPGIDIAPYLQSQKLPTQSTRVSTLAQTATNPVSKLKNETRTDITTSTKQSNLSKSSSKSDNLPLPTTQNKSSTQTKTQTETSTQTVTPTTVKIDANSPSRTPRLIIPTIDSSKRKTSKISPHQYPITWRYGLNWVLINPPYHQSDVHWLKYHPSGAVEVEGTKSAYRTIQSLGGNADIILDIDAGAFDIEINSPSQQPGKTGAIRFNRDRHNRTHQELTLKGVKLS